MEIPINDVRYEMIYDLLDGIYDNKSAFIDVDIKELLNHIINNKIKKSAKFFSTFILFLFTKYFINRFKH